MSDDSDPSRRNFVRLCGAAVALIGASPALLAQSGTRLHRYERVKLVDDRERPITTGVLKVGESYLFHYPYITTPCFLLNLGRPAKATQLQTEDGQPYQWSGGVGPQRSVVAFSAICAHKMSYPARQASFINYRHRPATFVDASSNVTERAQVIYCCSEKSVYDATEGARVLGGPAKQPLAAIVLEQDGDGAFYAVGTTGGELFDRFFEHFAFRLALDFQVHDVRKPTTKVATVMPQIEYCRNQILC